MLWNIFGAVEYYINDLRMWTEIWNSRDYYSKRALRMWTVNENQIAWFNSVSDEINGLI
jgi:hypothetical protein